jgi:long-chain acyl-CoA synthetase
MGLYDFTIYSVIKRNAFVYPDRLGWVFEGEQVTHAQFKERVDRLASGLSKIGLKKGDRIGVVALNSMNFAYLYGAAARIGAIMLPINWRLKPDEIEYVISDGAPEVIFAGGDFKSQIKSLAPKFKFVKQLYSLDEAGGGFSSFDKLMDNDGSCPDPDVHSDDAYVIIHTAAVSGKPRGATLSHQGLITANMQDMYIWSLTEKDAHLLVLPMFHVAGLGSALTAMQAGGANIIMSRFDAEQAVKNIEKYKVSFIVEFPPMLSSILDKNEEIKCDISSLRVIGGLEGPETAKRYQDLTGGTFWTAFGQSETSGFVTYAPYFEKPGSAGLPCHMAEVKLVNEAGQFVETGQVGEIVVRGPMVFKGYWNLDKDNEYTFRDGWHHTGDMGRFDEDGYLWYAGRMPEKELIKPGGENVYPSEVEKVILEHPAVMEVVVIGVPDKQWGEAIKAVCVLKQGKSLEESELIEFVGAKIARFKKPKHVVFVSDLPKAEDGSIDRAKVKEAHGRA